MQSIPDPRHALPDGDSGALAAVAHRLVIGAIIVTLLYFGRDILVPLVLAALLSFALWPIIAILRKARLGRAGSVLITVFLTIAGFVSLGTILAMQVSELVRDLPRYEANLRDKVRTLKGASMPSGVIEKAADTIQGLQDELKTTTPSSATGTPATSPGKLASATHKSPIAPPSPVIVEMRDATPPFLKTYQQLIRPLLSPVTTTALVVLFLIFILMQREDLRDRLLRLAGGTDLQRSTMAMNDAAERLSRFFLIQLVLNAGFGVVIGVGLAIVGVPSPALWGILAGLMRFVPYIGSFIAATFPIVLAAAVDPTWSMVAATAGLFAVAEPIAGQVIEPLLYGRQTGLSPVAIVISALFWTLLWGPVGLLLATPLTVCLVVLGKHVPALDFLAVVLGDEPALAPEQRLYQRLLAGDAGEASALAEESLETQDISQYYNSVAMDSLGLAHLDAARGRLSREAEAVLLATVQDVTLELAEYNIGDVPAAPQEDTPHASSPSPSPSPSGTSTPPSNTTVDHQNTSSFILCIAARSSLDEAAALLLSQLLAKRGFDSGNLGRIAASELNRNKFSADHTVVCVSQFGTDNPFEVRLLVRRLKRIAPQTIIVAGFWLLGDDPEKLLAWQKSSGADFTTASLAEAADMCALAASRGAPDPEQILQTSLTATTLLHGEPAQHPGRENGSSLGRDMAPEHA